MDSCRFSNHTRNFYDTSWNRLPLTVQHPGGSEDERLPMLGLMLNVARRLSRQFSSIRVDLYASCEEVKVGELTSCHGRGHEIVRPIQAELWMGSFFGSQSEDTVSQWMSMLGDCPKGRTAISLHIDIGVV